MAVGHVDDATRVEEGNSRMRGEFLKKFPAYEVSGHYLPPYFAYPSTLMNSRGSGGREMSSRPLDMWTMPRGQEKVKAS